MLIRLARAACVLILCLCCAACGEVKQEQGRYQAGPPSTIILIFIDALRADHLGCYGYPKTTSPAIDKLAAKGVLFENVITQGTWTLPSFFAVFASHYTPAVYGKGEQTLPLSLPLMPEYFKQAGYATAGFVDNGWLHAKYGFERGFDLYDCDARDGTGPILARALAWLRREPDRNHFLFIQTNDVHGPYKPPPPYDTIFVTTENLIEPEQGEGPPVSNESHVFNMIPKYQYLKGHRNLAYYVAQYDGCIRYVDSLLAAFFDALKDMDIFDDSLIVVAADHGESLTEHHFLLNHGITTEPVVKVPLIMKFPDLQRISGRFSGQVQLIDLLPTFLECLGIQPKQAISGTSLFKVIRGDVIETAPYAFCSEGVMVQHVVRSRRWKYVRKIPGSKEDLVWKTCPDSDPNDRDAVVEELYDLQADAMETCNIAEFDSKVKSKLSAMMDEWLARETQRRSQMSATSKVKLDEKTKRELEALGYAGG